MSEKTSSSGSSYTCVYHWQTDLVGGSSWVPTGGWNDPYGSTRLASVSGSTYHYDSTSYFDSSRSRSNDTYRVVYVQSAPGTQGPTGTQAVNLSGPIYTSTGGC